MLLDGNFVVEDKIIVVKSFLVFQVERESVLVFDFWKVLW